MRRLLIRFCIVAVETVVDVAASFATTSFHCDRIFLVAVKLLPQGMFMPTTTNGFINIQMTYMCLCQGLFQTTMKSTEPDGNENKIQENKCGTCCRRTEDH